MCLSPLRMAIHDYIYKQHDIQCGDVDLPTVVDQIFDLYKKNHPGENYLEGIVNDLVSFIGTRNELLTAQNMEGVRIWDALHAMTSPNNVPHEQGIKIAMTVVPKYYLLSFLGMAHYNYVAQ